MGKVKLELSEQSVKIIMEVLTQVSLPYNTTAPVIEEISTELNKQKQEPVKKEK